MSSHDDAGVGDDVERVARNREMASTLEHATLVPGQRTLEEVAARLAVAERGDVGRDQAFIRVGDETRSCKSDASAALIRTLHQLTFAGGSDRLVAWSRARRRSRSSSRYRF